MENFFFSPVHMARPLDLVCVENALMDMLLPCHENTLAEFGLERGTMKLVELHEQQGILDRVDHLTPQFELGGSGANVVRGMSILGSKTSYSSCIGSDNYGQRFSARLDELSIINKLCVHPSEHTGTCLVLVTPDHERTLNTYLGACRHYERSFLPLEDISSSRLFYTTGYFMDSEGQTQSFYESINFAKKNNVKVAFDIADPFVIKRHGQSLLMNILQSVDLLFINRQEAQMLIGITGEKAALELNKLVELVAVKDGENGAFVSHAGKCLHIPAEQVQVIDTTGAGDMFAAGFCHGLCQGLSLESCAKIASTMASDTITYLGARLTPNISEIVQNSLTSYPT